MTTQLVQSIHFDSSLLPIDQQFAAQQNFMRSYRIATPHPEAGFAARSTAWLLDGIIVNRTELGPLETERDAAMIRTDESSHYCAAVVLEGSAWEGSFDGVDIRVEPGETCMIDMTRPVRTRSGETTAIMVLFPRPVLDEVLPPRDIHGIVLDATAGRLLADYLQALVGRLPALPAKDAPAIARGTRDLFAATLSTIGARPQAKATGRVLVRAKQFIATHLTEDLSAASLAAALGISRATIFRTFEPMGGVERYVLGRRLARAHELLLKVDRPQTIAQVAYTVGFKSGAHFSRSFRRAYGCAPRDLATTRAAAGPSPDGDAHRVYDRWKQAWRR